MIEKARKIGSGGGAAAILKQKPKLVNEFELTDEKGNVIDHMEAEDISDNDLIYGDEYEDEMIEDDYDDEDFTQIQASKTKG